MTRKIFAELSRPIPRSLNWSHSKLIYAVQTPQRVTVMTGCRSYLIQPRSLIPRFGTIQLRLRARFTWTIRGSAVALNAEAWRNMLFRLRT